MHFPAELSSNLKNEKYLEYFWFANKSLSDLLYYNGKSKCCKDLIQHGSSINIMYGTITNIVYALTQVSDIYIAIY